MSKVRQREAARTASNRQIPEINDLAGESARRLAPLATQEDVRRIALSLPETVESEARFAFSVRNKAKLRGFVWVWMERITPKKARVPQPAVIAVRVANLDEKDALLAVDSSNFFTEPH